MIRCATLDDNFGPPLRPTDSGPEVFGSLRVRRQATLGRGIGRHSDTVDIRILLNYVNVVHKSLAGRI